MSKPLRLIHVEDSAEFADLTDRLLHEEFAHVDIARVVTLAELKKRMADGPWDLVLSKCRMRRFDAFRILERLQTIDPHVPLIVISPAFSAREAVRLFRAGARDIIGTNELARLPLAIRRELEHAKHRRKRRQAENALRNSRNILQSLIDTTDESVLMVDSDGRILVSNRAFAGRFRLEPKDAKGRGIDELYSRAEAKPRMEAIRRAIKARAPVRHEIDWKDRIFEANLNPVFDEGGNAVAVVVFSRDVTHLRRAEEALRASESRLRAVIDSSPSSISLKNRKGEYLLINKEFGRRFNAEEENVIGKTVTDIAEKDFAERIDRMDRRAITLKRPVVEEADVFDTDGTARSYLITKFPIPGPDGRIAGVGTINTDITNRKAVERALRVSEGRFRAFMEASPESLFLKDLDRRYLAANPAFERRHGVSSNDIIGRRVDEFYPRGNAAATHRQDNEVLSSGETRYFEVDWFDANGARLVERVVKFPIRDADGSVIGLGGNASDITPLKRAREALERSNRALRTLIACNEILVRAKSETDLLREVCRTIVEVGGHPFAWVGFAENDKAKTLRPVAVSGGSDRTPDTYGPSWATGPRGRCPTGIAIRTGEICVVRDGFKAKRFEACRDFTEANGYTAAIALPLKAGGPVIGALTIFSDVPGIFDEDEVTLLGELVKDVNYGIAALREAGERERAEEDRRKLSRAVEQSPTIVVVTDAKGVIEYVNPKFTEVTGYTAHEAVGHRPNLLKSGETHDAEYATLWKTISSGRQWRGVFHNRRKDGSYYWADTAISPVKAADGTITNFVGIQEDISERLQTEQRLNQLEKMESLGNLAGGIAHDFNNMLLPIQSLTAMTLRDIPEGTSAAKRLQKVLEASQRAGELVRRILAFSRSETSRRRPEDIRRVVGDALALLRSTIPATIRIVERTAEVGDVVMDGAQIQTVILNLASNASDAMLGKPGTLYVSLSRSPITTPPVTTGAVIDPGDYAKITVRDTGSGMPPEVLDRIFEPFFTTKGVGEGTGLGLAMVHGIVTKHGGAITVESKPGLGTTFEIFLPILGEASRPSVAA